MDGGTLVRYYGTDLPTYGICQEPPGMLLAGLLGELQWAPNLGLLLMLVVCGLHHTGHWRCAAPGHQHWREASASASAQVKCEAEAGDKP